MKYLLDVNLLVALGHQQHALHPLALQWRAGLPAADGLFSCSITELGFLRVVMRTGMQPDLPAALSALADLKRSGPIGLLPDDVSATDLPPYVRKPAETTDGHLLSLAKRHGAKLATLDTGIPGAHLIV